MIVIKRGDDMEYVEIDGHKLHQFREQKQLRARF